jgi:hypothetical protein
MEITLTIKIQRLKSQDAQMIQATLCQTSNLDFSEALEALYLSIPEDRLVVDVSVQPDGYPIGESDG